MDYFLNYIILDVIFTEFLLKVVFCKFNQKTMTEDMKLTQQDIARILGIDTKTLYNWRKRKPELYKKVMQGFALEKAVEEARLHYENLKSISESIKKKD